MRKDPRVDRPARRERVLLAPRSRWEGLMRSASTGARGVTEIGRRRIYILPTGFGVAFAVTLLLMFFGSLNYMNNLGLLFTFILGALGLVAMLHTWRNLLGVRVSVGDARPVFARTTAGFPVSLCDPREHRRPGLALIGGERPQAVEIPAGSSTSVNLEVLAQRRGEHRLGRFRLETRYPLGLFRAWSLVDSDARVVVYPQPAREAPAMPLTASGVDKSGNGSRGRGTEDFAGLRAYRQGDPLSRMYWKGVAREGELLVKQFAGDHAEELWLDWDLLPGTDPELRLSLICRKVLDADRTGQRYGMRLPGQALGVGGGPAQRERCLRALALYDVDGGD